MIRLFDSTVLIAHLRGVPEASAQLARAAEAEEARASVLSRVEVEGGMRSGERGAVARLFAALDLEVVTDQIAGVAGRYLRRYRQSHAAIDVVDYVIAATAEVTGAELCTLNVKHFPMFPNLRPAF